MSSKIGAASQSWPNVNKAIETIKAEDKTLIKVIKFIPNVIKLIGAIFMDLINSFSRNVLPLFGIRLKAMGSEPDYLPDTQKTVEKTKNFWANYKGKILLGLGILGVVGLGYYLSLPRVVSNPCTESFVRGQKDEMEFVYNLRIRHVNRDRKSDYLYEKQNSDGTKSVIASTCQVEQNVINPSEMNSTIGMKPLASIIGRIVQETWGPNGAISSEEIQRTYQEDLILDGGKLRWDRKI